MKKLLSMLTVAGLLSSSAGAGIIANNQTGLGSYSINDREADLHYWSDINLSHSVSAVTNEGLVYDDATVLGSTTKSWDFFQQTNVLIIEGSFEWHNSIKPLTLSSDFLFISERDSDDSTRVWYLNRLINESNGATEQANFIQFIVTATHNEDGTVSLKLDSFIIAESTGEELPCSTSAKVDQIMFFHL